MQKIYVGVVGQIACGKGILVGCLVKKHGFISFSLSTIVHQELQKRGIKNFDRKTLQDVGDDLRKKYGGDVLVKRAIKQLKNTSIPGKCTSEYVLKIIIEGIRNPAEIEYLKKMPNFTLIGVKARRELRFQRLLKRNKPWDPKTYEEFIKVDRRDLGQGQDKSGQQVGKCLAYCDYVLTNNKDIKDFQRKVKKLIKKIFNYNGDSLDKKKRKA